MQGPSWGFVGMVAFPDLRARGRRFFITAIGMALIFAMTLLLSAFSEGFNLRAERLIGVMGADEYVVRDGIKSPFRSFGPIPADVADRIEALPSVERADPVFFLRNAVSARGTPQNVLVVGFEPGGLGEPERIIEGRNIEAPGEIVLDTTVDGMRVGDVLKVGEGEATVVGITEWAELDIATAALFVRIDDAQRFFAGGEPIATAILVDGATEALPPEVDVFELSAVERDLLEPVRDAKRSIDAFKWTLWILAVVIVGAILYLAAIERTRDFAVFKATGAANVDLILGLGLQAVIIAVVAALFSIVLATLLMPIYPGLLSLPLRIMWPVIPVAVGVSLIGSVAGVRKAISIDPAQAFGGP